MSKYTTEVRFICETASGLGESKGFADVDTIITNAIPKIFNFNFPIFDENYRSILEKKILKHFYTREICEETVGLWKLRLDTKLNEIMPYYNKLYKSELLEFNPLYTHNLTRTKNGTQNNTNKGTVESTRHSKETGSVAEENTNTSVDKYSETPQGSLSNVENGSYLTNARIVNDSTNTYSTSDNTSDNSDSVQSNETSDTTENYLESVVGYDGRSASKLLKDYRDTFINIDTMIINELEDLYMQLW